MVAPVFVVLSFEGPDAYSRAGGLASRITGLTETLARMGAETHLFFIGDPGLPGHEVREHGRLHLHRWCQWISQFHPGGVYDGEEGKLNDWNRSLPAWLGAELFGPAIEAGRKIVVLAEEWHTARVVVSLHHLTMARGWQREVALMWNANNTFGAHRIPWPDLGQSSRITTVSRYMKHVLWRYGVDASVIPNGLQASWLAPADASSVHALRTIFQTRLTLLKVARFDPDKRWDMAVDAVAMLKADGASPVFLARGGAEKHGSEVVRRAERLGLRTARVTWGTPDAPGLLDALRPAAGFDMLLLDGYLSEEQRRVLYNGTHAVLANSGIEPFGLVGLETMASGGVAMVGATGEDYATNGYDSISIQSNDPMEIVHHTLAVRRRPEAVMRMRNAARSSAARYTWNAVIERVLLPYVAEHGVDVDALIFKPSGPSELPGIRRPVLAGGDIARERVVGIRPATGPRAKRKVAAVAD